MNSGYQIVSMFTDFIVCRRQWLYSPFWKQFQTELQNECNSEKLKGITVNFTIFKDDQDKDICCWDKGNSCQIQTFVRFEEGKKIKKIKKEERKKYQMWDSITSNFNHHSRKSNKKI